MSGLKPPRRKRRVYQQVDSPLPIPIESVTNKPASSKRWFYYTAQLKTNTVLVQQQGDVTFLYKMGFFGKGLLSKSKPEHSIFLNSYQGLRKKNLPPNERRFQQQRFQQVRKTRYQRHLEWSKQFVSQTQKTVKGSDSALSTSLDDTSGTDEASATESCQQKRFKVQHVDRTAEKDDEYTHSDDIITGTDVATETDDVTDRTGGVLREDPGILDNSSVSHDATAGTDDVATRTCDVVKRPHDDVITGTDDVITETDDVIAGTDDVTTGTDDVTTGTDDVTTGTGDVTTTCDDDVRASCGDVTEVAEVLPKSTEDCEKSAIQARKSPTDVEIAEASTNKVFSNDAGQQETQDSSLPETEGGETQEKMEEQGIIRKDDPYQIHEYLHLKLEEAFFLSYGLGCLTVLDETKKALDLTEMWQTFRARQSSFVANYVAYHYYRSKGWVPRDGLKYGAQFVLYKYGPPFYHGSYSVLVQMVTEGSWDVSESGRIMTWPAVSGMDRITETVAKQVLFCYVIKPSDTTDDDMQTPKCIPRFKVQEITMTRWVSSRERELKDQRPSLIS